MCTEGSLSSTKRLTATLHMVKIFVTFGWYGVESSISVKQSEPTVDSFFCRPSLTKRFHESPYSPQPLGSCCLLEPRGTALHFCHGAVYRAR